MTPDAAAKKPIPAILALSVVIAALLIWLIYFRDNTSAPQWTNSLPLTEAIFNSISAVCLSLGYYNIRRGRRDVHQRFMLSATVSSGLFLIAYLVYHFFHGDTKFPGQGWIRPVYFTFLISHIVMAAIALPLILATLWFAVTRQFQPHRKVSRWTFPIWLYVSVTGVIVYAVLQAYTA